MPEFRLTQISDTDLARRLQELTDNFHRMSEHIDATRPDLVVNTGDIFLGRADQPDDLEFAHEMHEALPRLAAFPRQSRHRRQPDGTRPGAVSPRPRKAAGFLDCPWRRPLALRGSRLVFYRTELAGHEHRPCERGRAVRLAGSELASVDGKPVALFLHKPLFLNSPDDPELAASAIRYVPQPAAPPDRDASRSTCGWSPLGHVHQRRDFTYGQVRHVWAPSAGFIIPDRMQEVIGTKEVGLVEYRFQPDAFEVRHVRARARPM